MMNDDNKFYINPELPNRFKLDPEINKPRYPDLWLKANPHLMPARNNTKSQMSLKKIEESLIGLNSVNLIDESHCADRKLPPVTLQVPYESLIISFMEICSKEDILYGWTKQVESCINFAGTMRKVTSVRIIDGYITIDLE